ncbi:hypothetical protein AAFO92_00355 [Roseovarius sp. CAU 1744]|uniref:hypothetical protein n=1 Tax=Roseovarius sp. CAU 1744 TaxID=3140368 RepID=UPI00325B34FA
MAAPLPLCIVGAGSIGMRHVEVAQVSDRVHLTAVVEADATRGAGLARAGLPVVASLTDVPAERRGGDRHTDPRSPDKRRGRLATGPCGVGGKAGRRHAG